MQIRIHINVKRYAPCCGCRPVVILGSRVAGAAVEEPVPTIFLRVGSGASERPDNLHDGAQRPPWRSRLFWTRSSGRRRNSRRA